VKEVDVLSESLKEVWMSSFKLWVNLSRFKRSEGQEMQLKNTTEVSPVVSQEVRRLGRSYCSALVGRSTVPKVLKVPINEELCKELQGSMVGKLTREKDVRRIQTTLYIEGFKSITVTHMGGNMVLIRSPVIGDVSRLLRSKNECINYYFSDLKPWNPGLLAI
jgi:hypothetical protein